tara:strand:+ start:5185 stop:7281 length:2097 start_codon:yes stop_codon:yes gene_type:complete
MKEDFIVIFNQGLNLHQNDNLDKAISKYKEVLKINNLHFDSLHLLGVANSQLGNHEVGIEFIQKAISLNQSNPMAYNNIANIFSEIQKHDQALIYINKSLSIKPENIDAISIKGKTLFSLDRHNEALQEYNKLLNFNPNHAETYYNKGILYSKLSQKENAIENYKKAIALKPDYSIAHYNLGNLYFELDKIEDAKNYFKNAIFYNQSYSDAQHNLGSCLVFLNKLDEALICFKKALSINSNDYKSYHSMIDVQLKLSDWNLLDEYIKKFENLKNYEKNNLPINMLALFDNPEMHKTISEKYLSPRLKLSVGITKRKKETLKSKIKIAYFSSDFLENNPVSYLISELIKFHNRDIFEVYGFSLKRGEPKDEIRKYFQKTFDKFIDVDNKSDEEIAELSRNLNVDIAIDLNGYTRGSRPEIFAYKVAPILVNYLGYPSTLGAKYYDYIIADKVVIPPLYKKYYTEKVVYLPDTYFVNPSNRKIFDKVPTKKEFSLPETGFIFCCFNKNYKILPATFKIWMNILLQVEGSVLWLSNMNLTAQNNLRKEAEKKGVKGSRLIFADHLSNHDNHLARYQLADLFLDTFPYNAHTTALDALWSGLPLLTCTGKTFTSRVAASLLKAINMSELITHFSKDFESKAIEIASCPIKFEEIKNKLINNKYKEPLFNGDIFKDNFEAALKKMYLNYKLGLKPTSFEIQNK